MPKNPIDFLIWFFAKIPRHLFRVMLRIIKIFNNDISFTTNIKLLGTPLFGDYSWIGRFTGFVFRAISIVLGLGFLGGLFLLCVILPITWVTLPVALFYFKPLYGLIFLGIVAIFWYVSTLNTPRQRITNISSDNYTNALRPNAFQYLRKAQVNPKNALVSIMETKEIRHLLVKAELPKPELLEKINQLQTSEIKDLREQLVELAKKHKSHYIEIEYLFYVLLTNLPTIENILAVFDLEAKTLEDTVDWVVQVRESAAKEHLWQEDYVSPPDGGIGRGMTGRVTPLLDAISTDFTKMAGKGKIKALIGRHTKIEKMAEILSGEMSNVLVIGNPGSGKTTVVKGIAYEIMAGTKYKSLNNKRIVSLDLARLVAGAGGKGALGDRIATIMNEIKASKDIILFIDEIHTLLAVETGESNAEVSSIYAMLEPYIAGQGIQFIGATSIPNYRKYIEPNSAFSNLFQIVEIEDATKEETLEILKVISEETEEKKHITVTYPALLEIINLSKKLIHERVFPDKAVFILTRNALAVENNSKTVSTKSVAKEISEMTHIPMEAISQGDAKKLLELEANMKKEVIGQDLAISQITESLKRGRVGLRNENKPIASFLFVGTTGVGKTQTAKALAKNYFGDKKAMIRLDMSEYQQLDSLNRLIGAPDGSIKGILTESVRTKPFSLILLDEIEKAHQNVLLAFLQVLDDGRLTDSFGVTADFTNTIIIATSNVGTKAIQEVLNGNGTKEEMVSEVIKQVREKFAPEFINRFSGIIVFNPLTRTNVEAITNLLLEEVRIIGKDKGINITFKKEVIEELMKRGYDPQWGARPMTRQIENSIENYLANLILNGKITRGQEISLGLEVFGN